MRKALKHTGADNKAMRDELARAVAELFATKLQEPARLSDFELLRLENVVLLGVRLRAHVTRDRFSREIESIHGAEGPGRLAISLERLFAGLVAIGLSREQALGVTEDVALDSVPPVRRHAFELLTENPTPTRTIAKALRLPTTTTHRALEDLAAQGLATRSRAASEDGTEKGGGADLWRLDREWEAWAGKWKATVEAGDALGGGAPEAA
jgi:hypothetical protein